jgi:hypothetical protein
MRSVYAWVLLVLAYSLAAPAMLLSFAAEKLSDMADEMDP